MSSPLSQSLSCCLALLASAAGLSAQECAPIEGDSGTVTQVPLGGGLFQSVIYIGRQYQDCGVIFSCNGNNCGGQTQVFQFPGPPPNNWIVGTSMQGGNLMPDASVGFTMTYGFHGQQYTTDQVQFDCQTTGAAATFDAYGVGGGAPLVTVVSSTGTVALGTLTSAIHRVEVTPAAGGTVRIDKVTFGPCPPLLGPTNCPGGGSVHPRLTKTQLCAAGGQIELLVRGGAPASTGAFLYSTTPGVTLFAPGCVLDMASPVVGPNFTFDGAGRSIYVATFPGIPPGVQIYVHAMVPNPFVANGFSASNLLTIN